MKPARPTHGKLGPAMLALPNDHMRAFVQCFVDTGGRSATEAARMAGYSDNSSLSLRVHANRLAHDSRIQAAIQEQARNMMTAAAVMAVGTITTIAANPTHKDQLRAALAILDRTGLHAMTENKTTVEVSINRDEQIREVIAMCKEVGMDPRKVLGERGIVLDAEFQVVSDKAALPAPKPLEDWDDDDFTGTAP